MGFDISAESSSKEGNVSRFSDCFLLVSNRLKVPESSARRGGIDLVV